MAYGSLANGTAGTFQEGMVDNPAFKFYESPDYYQATNGKANIHNTGYVPAPATGSVTGYAIPQRQRTTSDAPVPGLARRHPYLLAGAVLLGVAMLGGVAAAIFAFMRSGASSTPSIGGDMSSTALFPGATTLSLSGSTAHSLGTWSSAYPTPTSQISSNSSPEPSATTIASVKSTGEALLSSGLISFPASTESAVVTASAEALTSYTITSSICTPSTLQAQASALPSLLTNAQSLPSATSIVNTPAGPITVTSVFVSETSSIKNDATVAVLSAMSQVITGTEATPSGTGTWYAISVSSPSPNPTSQALVTSINSAAQAAGTITGTIITQNATPTPSLLARVSSTVTSWLWGSTSSTAPSSALATSAAMTTSPTTPAIPSPTPSPTGALFTPAECDSIYFLAVQMARQQRITERLAVIQIIRTSYGNRLIYGIPAASADSNEIVTAYNSVCHRKV